jgi:predicted nucleotidyltransferase
MSTKNLTIRLSDHLIEASKEYAKKQGKSLNELIREFLQGNVKKPKDYLTTSERIAAFSEENAGYGGGAKFDRDKANER